MAKWVADWTFVEGIYDLLIDMQMYPYLDARKEYAHTATVQDLAEKDHATIDLDQPNTVAMLYEKLNNIESMGYGEDGGFPILSREGQVLEGYIASSELSHALDQLQRHFDASPYPISQQERLDMPCYFNRTKQGLLPEAEDDNDDLVRRLMTAPNSPTEEIFADTQSMSPMNDFSAYVDQVRSSRVTCNLHLHSVYAGYSCVYV